MARGEREEGKILYGLRLLTSIVRKRRWRKKEIAKYPLSPRNVRCLPDALAWRKTLLLFKVFLGLLFRGQWYASSILTFVVKRQIGICGHRNVGRETKMKKISLALRRLHARTHAKMPNGSTLPNRPGLPPKDKVSALSEVCQSN